MTEVNVRDIIERLRDATAAAGETITEAPPLRLPEPRPRPWLTPLAAAAAVVLAIAGGVGAYRVVFGERAAPAEGVAPLPRFFAHVAGTDVVVRSSDGGREVGRVAAPSAYEWYAHVAAAGDNRTFFAATEAKDCTARLYRFTVGEDGRVAKPEALPYRPPEGTLVTSLAVSGDGKTVAYGLQSCEPAATTGRITVADTATGRTREWRGDRPVTGLSLSRDGRYLAFREATLLTVFRVRSPRPGSGDPAVTEPEVVSSADVHPVPAEAAPSPEAAFPEPTPSESPEVPATPTPSSAASGPPSPARPGDVAAVPEPAPAESFALPKHPITPDPTDPPIREPYPGVDGLSYPASPVPKPVPTAGSDDVRYVRVPDGRVRVLDTTTEPGDLRRSRMVPLTGPWGDVVCGVTISPDGTRLYAGVGYPPAAARPEAATAGIAEFDASSGEPLRHLTRIDEGLLCLVDGDGGGTRFLVRHGGEYGVVADTGGYRTLATVGAEPRTAAAW